MNVDLACDSSLCYFGAYFLLREVAYIICKLYSYAFLVDIRNI